MYDLDSLKNTPHWVCWRYETRGGNQTKVPYQVNRRHADSTDAASWNTYAACTDAFIADTQFFAGVGYVFSGDDPFCGIDLDHCITDAGVEPWAERIIAAMQPTYMEISPSGEGIKIWIEAAMPTPPDGKLRHKKMILLGGHPRCAIEIYDSARFFTFTGDRYGDSDLIAPRQAALDALYAELFGHAAPPLSSGAIPLSASPSSVSAIPSTSQTATITSAATTLDDDHILAAARRAKNADKFARLMAGDTAMHGNDDSSADLALVSMLAFYTQDAAQIDRIFRTSGLFREKWNRADYRERTITKAIGGLSAVYTPTPADGADAPAEDIYWGKTQDGEFQLYTGGAVSGVVAAATVPAGGPAGFPASDVSHDQPPLPRTSRPASAAGQAAAQQPDEPVNAEEEEFPPDTLPENKGFPVWLFPATIREYIEASAKSLSAPIEYIALPLLSAAAAAIGITRRIQIKPGWCEYPVIWTCIVGPTGTLKTAAISEGCFANHAFSDRAYEKYQTDLENFKEAEAEHEAARRKKVAGEHGPKHPIEKQYVCEETTIEALIYALKDNDRGMLLSNDELDGWFKSFGEYKGGRGSDRAQWLKLFSSKKLDINRKTEEVKHICIKRSAVSVAGAIQPKILKELLTEDMHTSGLAPRFLFAYPTPRPSLYTKFFVLQHLKDGVLEIFQRLFALEGRPDAGGKIAPITIPITPDAEDIWEPFHNKNAITLASLDDDNTKGIYNKTRTYAARLTLVMHCLHAVSEYVPNDAVIGPESINKGIELATWFRDEQERAHAKLNESNDNKSLRELVEYVAAHGGRMNAWDLRRNLKKYRDGKTYRDAVATLVSQKRIVREFELNPHARGKKTEFLRIV